MQGAQGSIPGQGTRSHMQQLKILHPSLLLAVKLGTDSLPNLIQLCCDAYYGAPEKGFVIPTWLLAPQRCSQEEPAIYSSTHL